MVQEVVVVPQLQILGVGKLQQVRNVHAAGGVVDHSAVPGQICHIVRVGEPVGQRGCPGFLVDRVRVLQQEGYNIPVLGDRILEIVHYEIFIVTGNVLVGAGRPDGFHGCVQETAELLIRQVFHCQHQIQKFLIGKFFLLRNIEKDTDNAQVLDAGLYFHQIFVTGDLHFVEAKLHQYRGIVEGDGFCRDAVQAQAG